MYIVLRLSCPCTKGPRGCKGPALLHCGDSLHGDALESQYFGRYRERCTFPFLVYSNLVLTWLYSLKHSIPAPPPREKIYSSDDQITLEDESGRIQLAGEKIMNERLVTGVILGALGFETSSGEFQVVDVCYAGMAPQPGHRDHEQADGMDVDDLRKDTVFYMYFSITQLITDIVNESSSKLTQQEEYVAFISGLDIGSPAPADAQIQMLVEYLTGEAGGLDDQISASQISRLVILGNSLSSAVNAQLAADDSPKDNDKKAVRVFPSFRSSYDRSLSYIRNDTAMIMQYFLRIQPPASQVTYTILRVHCPSIFLPGLPTLPVLFYLNSLFLA